MTKAKKIVLAGAIAVCALGAAAFLPVGGVDAAKETPSTEKADPMDLSSFSDSRPSKSLHLLFIHHSCGGQWFADIGADVGQNCIYATHPNGGGLRKILVSNGYIVHEASYGSEVGDRTDIFDWPPKFSGKMDKVLTVDNQNAYFTDGTRNQVVMFKSCFPNSAFQGTGEAPGNAAGPQLTVWNAKAAYTALLGEFAKHPETLFITITAPPMVGSLPSEPLWKSLARVVMSKPRTTPSTSGHLARTFNNWLKGKDGWLKSYAGNNVVVFDYYDIMTGSGKSNHAEYPSGRNRDDSHPSSEGNSLAAKAFVPFLNKVVRRAGLSD